MVWRDAQAPEMESEEASAAGGRVRILEGRDPERRFPSSVCVRLWLTPEPSKVIACCKKKKKALIGKEQNPESPYFNIHNVQDTV